MMPELTEDLQPLTRRSILKLGALVTGTALLAVSGGLAWFGSSRIELPGLPASITTMTQEQYHLFYALLKVLFPVDGSDLPEPEELGVIEDIDRMIALLPKHIQSDLSLATTLFNKGAVIVGFNLKPFTDLNQAEAEAYFSSWHRGTAIQRGIATALKKLAYVSYWRNSRTWEAIDYDGPVTKRYSIPSLGISPAPSVNSGHLS